MRVPLLTPVDSLQGEGGGGFEDSGLRDISSAKLCWFQVSIDTRVSVDITISLDTRRFLCYPLDMSGPPVLQDPLLVSSEDSSPDEPLILPVPLPSLQTAPIYRAHSSLTPVVCDERAISRLLELILIRSGLSISEVARRMCVTPNSVRQYINGRRSKPSLLWVVKFAETCGSHISIETPSRSHNGR